MDEHSKQTNHSACDPVTSVKQRTIRQLKNIPATMGAYKESVSHPLTHCSVCSPIATQNDTCHTAWAAVKKRERKAKETEALHNTVIAIHNTHWRIKGAIRGLNLGAIKSF